MDDFVIGLFGSGWKRGGDHCATAWTAALPLTDGNRRRQTSVRGRRVSASGVASQHSATSHCRANVPSAFERNIGPFQPRFSWWSLHAGILVAESYNRIELGNRLLRRRDVELKTGKSRSAIYAGVSNGTFPAPVPIGDKSVAWLEEEVEDDRYDRLRRQVKEEEKDRGVQVSRSRPAETQKGPPGLVLDDFGPPGAPQNEGQNEVRL